MHWAKGTNTQRRLFAMRRALVLASGGVWRQAGDGSGKGADNNDTDDIDGRGASVAVSDGQLEL